MEDKQNILGKLQSLVSGEPSNWTENAEFRISNKKWLRRSQIVAIKILGELRRQGLTQKDLADRMGISAQQVNKWVKGTENFTFETVSKLEEALSMNLMSVELDMKPSVSDHKKALSQEAQETEVPVDIKFATDIN